MRRNRKINYYEGTNKISEIGEGIFKDDVLICGKKSKYDINGIIEEMAQGHFYEDTRNKLSQGEMKCYGSDGKLEKILTGSFNSVGELLQGNIKIYNEKNLIFSVTEKDCKELHRKMGRDLVS